MMSKRILYDIVGCVYNVVGPILGVFGGEIVFPYEPDVFHAGLTSAVSCLCLTSADRMTECQPQEMITTVKQLYPSNKHILRL